MKTLINWKIFWLLFLAAIVATVLLLPYALEMQSSAIDLTKLPIPLPVVVLLQVVQNGILFAIAIFAGLFFAERVGLQLPMLESLTRGESIRDQFRRIWPLSVSLGVVTTLLVLALEFIIFQPALASQLGSAASSLNLRTGQPAAWKGFLASFYGGIAEEILLRLFVMSLLVWLGHFLSKTADGKPTAIVFWIANLLAAILFGLGHLPATAALVPITGLVVLRAVVLNGLIGIVCGWLFWKRGLESAMIAHFSADMVLHVLLAI